MHSFYKLRENAERELKIIEDKGLEKGNIELAGKLTEMIKALDKIEMMQNGGDYEHYSNDSEDYSRNDSYPRDDYDRGNSYRKGRNPRTGEYIHRPNHSRLSGDDTDLDRYKEDKKHYSNSRNGNDKERMLNSLNRLVGNFCDMVAQVYRDCDCPDERDIIVNHINNLRDRIRR